MGSQDPENRIPKIDNRAEFLLVDSPVSLNIKFIRIRKRVRFSKA